LTAFQIQIFKVISGALYLITSAFRKCDNQRKKRQQ